MSASATTDPFLLGETWRVIPAQHMLICEGNEVRVEPKVMDVLCVLAADPGHTVLRQTLLDTAWPDVFVEENALSRAISQLRKALDDSARQPQFVETIPKKGYRLVADVQPVAPDPEPAAVSERELEPEPMTTTSPQWRAVVALGAVVLLLGAAVLLRGPSVQQPWPRTLLTSFPGMETQPAFSPDGQTLAYTRSDESFRNLGVFVQRLDEDAPMHLSSPPVGDADASIAWAPDGTELAFIRSHPDGQRTLWRQPADGGTPRQVAGLPAGPVGLVWLSGKGGFIVAARHENRSGLVRISPDGQTLERLTSPEATAIDRFPTLSPDGRHLAFVRQTDGQDDVWVYPLNGRGPSRRLTWDAMHVPGLTWTADGRNLLFSASRDGIYKLWQIDREGGTPAWFTQAQAYDPGTPVFSADGNRLAYADYFFDTDVYAQPRGATEGIRLAPSTQWDQHVHAARGHIVFVSNRTGTAEVWTAQADGAQAQRLTHFGSVTATPRLAPDGERIAFIGSRQGQMDVYVVGRDGTGLRQLTDDAATDTTPVWSPDGQWVYLRTSQDGRWHLRRVSADGGPVESLTAGYRLGVLPDNRLVFTRQDTDGLWSLGGSTPTLLSEHLTPADEWTTGPDGVYVLERGNGYTDILHLDLDTGARTHRARLPVTTAQDISPFTVTEGAYYVTAVNRAESDIVWVQRRGR